MKNDNLKFYYYGIALFFVAKMIVDITTCSMYMIINFFNLSIWIAPIVVATVCIALMYLFLFRRTIPKTIKPLIFTLVILVSIILSKLLVYNGFFVKYSDPKSASAFSVIKGIDYFFFFSFGIITYAKYCISISKKPTE